MREEPRLSFPELDALREFADPYFSLHGFEVEAGGPYRPSDLDNRIVSFGHANGSGSMYALWLRDDRTDLATLPVVAVGDEGGLQIVARDFREFLRLIASLPDGAEADIDEVSFGVRGDFDDEDDEPDEDEDAEEDDDDLNLDAENKPPFLAWLDKRFGIAPTDDWETIVDAAQAEHAAEWAAWLYPLSPGDVHSPVHELNLLERFTRGLFKQPANGFWLDRAFNERKRRTIPKLTNRALPDSMNLFGTNGTDTFFALDADGRVVAVGHAAGLHPVARDLTTFLRLIAGLTDTEIWCDGNEVGLRPCEPAPARADYVAWLEHTLGLRPAEDPEGILAAARN